MGMETLQEYIKPELLVLVAVLCFTGNVLKRSQDVPDRLIPALLGVFGIVLAFMWVVSTTQPKAPYEWLTAAFTAIVQGILIAAQSVYMHQLVHQQRKDTLQKAKAKKKPAPEQAASAV